MLTQRKTAEKPAPRRENKGDINMAAVEKAGGDLSGKELCTAQSYPREGPTSEEEMRRNASAIRACEDSGLDAVEVAKSWTCPLTQARENDLRPLALHQPNTVISAPYPPVTPPQPRWGYQSSGGDALACSPLTPTPDPRSADVTRASRGYGLSQSTGAVPARLLSRYAPLSSDWFAGVAVAAGVEGPC
ncbi:hypothetical protein DPEC_G00315230 [Dallia pectoralis]|uniref:Uncharacterized protein n=1 Tax=Dallia pectoralis TaxID=75939 RepID=A0ACC2FCB0_DALPE|nr:hypothetical protein DPEC_G00315230 [Dallia pectoralis]